MGTWFNHLNVPQHWRQYWSKYPEGYTILEALLNWVAQVDSMTDNINNWNTYLDGFVKSFDTELQGKVDTVLKEWQASGLLSEIIQEALKTDLTSIKADVQQLQEDTAALETELTADIAALQTKTDVMADLTLYPQAPKPEKAGIKTCTPKIVRKKDVNTMEVFQKTNKGYVRYQLEKNNGASQADRDYGGSHELLRVTNVQQMQEIYVYKDLKTPITGAVTELYAPAMLNNMEDMLVYCPQHDPSKSVSSKTGNTGMGCYTVAPTTEVTYQMNITSKRKANLVGMATPASSTDVQIFVNGILVKSFNPKSFLNNGGITASAYLVDFEIPSLSTTQNKVDVKIRNNAASGSLYIAALNFFFLKDYDNQDIDNFKAFGSNRNPWIDNSGSSDYALYDKDAQRWFGSYHGGEVSEYDRIYWASALVPETDYHYNLSQFIDIVIGDWRIMKQFYIYQQTALANGQARMVSRFDFDTDGSLEMDFGYYGGNVNLGTIYTALTCTSLSFNYLLYPIFYQFGDVPTNDYFSYKLAEGKISQVDGNSALQLDIRFTKFNNKYDDRGPTIWDSPAYRKFYYGPIYGSNGVKLKELTFSKGLDFIVR